MVGFERLIGQYDDDGDDGVSLFPSPYVTVNVRVQHRSVT